MEKINRQNFFDPGKSHLLSPSHPAHSEEEWNYSGKNIDGVSE